MILLSCAIQQLTWTFDHFEGISPISLADRLYFSTPHPHQTDSVISYYLRAVAVVGKSVGAALNISDNIFGGKSDNSVSDSLGAGQTLKSL